MPIYLNCKLRFRGVFLWQQNIKTGCYHRPTVTSEHQNGSLSSKPIKPSVWITVACLKKRYLFPLHYNCLCNVWARVIQDADIWDEQPIVKSSSDERNDSGEGGPVESHLRPAASLCMAASRSSDRCCERLRMLRSSCRWSRVPTSSPRTVFIWLSSSCVRCRELRRSRLLRWTFCSRSDTEENTLNSQTELVC